MMVFLVPSKTNFLISTIEKTLEKSVVLGIYTHKKARKFWHNILAKSQEGNLTEKKQIQKKVQQHLQLSLRLF